MKKILVTGGAGYVGCVLVPKLLERGYEVVVYDLMIFGTDGLPEHENLKSVTADIRDTETFAKECSGVDAIIHLACISNDPSFELDSGLSKSINFDCFEPMVVAAKEAGVGRFIYASTSSVYGVSESPNVTEDHPLVPLTDYNKFKGMTEPLLLKHQSESFIPVIIRPATICGYSPRTRLDLSVNILTNFAVNKGKITVFGGAQKRPNIHIEDITDLYADLIEVADEKIAGEIYNAGYQNQSISELAGIVRDVVSEQISNNDDITIETTPSDDLRSYQVNSDKIEQQLGFKPQRTIEDAVKDLCKAFRDGKLPDSFEDSNYFNVRKVQEFGLK